MDKPWPAKGGYTVGDCCEILDSFPDDCIPLSVFSPPYDKIRSYGNDWSLDLRKLGCQLHRVTMDGGIAAMIINDSTKNFALSLTSFRTAIAWCDLIGWRMFSVCLYAKDAQPGAWWNTRFRHDHEYIFFFLKGARPRQFDKSQLMIPALRSGKYYHGSDRCTDGAFKKQQRKVTNPLKCRGTIWRYDTSKVERNSIKARHPATFPDRLAADIIMCFSKPGEIVLDPLAGSGTTAIQARKLGRIPLAIDINPEYQAIYLLRKERELSGIDNA
jgi:DNA modification methylase